MPEVNTPNATQRLAKMLSLHTKPCRFQSGVIQTQIISNSLMQERLNIEQFGLFSGRRGFHAH